MLRSQFVDRVVRRLTERYGITVTFKNESERSTDYASGNVNRTFEVVSCKALVEESDAKKDFIYDLSFIAANKNFTYGGIFDTEQIWVTVRRELLGTFVVNSKTLIVIGGKVHVVKRVSIEQSGVYYYKILAKRTEKVDLGQVRVSNKRASFVLSTTGPTVVIS